MAYHLMYELGAEFWQRYSVYLEISPSRLWSHFDKFCERVWYISKYISLPIKNKGNSRVLMCISFIFKSIVLKSWWFPFLACYAAELFHSVRKAKPHDQTAHSNQSLRCLQFCYVLFFVSWPTIIIWFNLIFIGQNMNDIEEYQLICVTHHPLHPLPVNMYFFLKKTKLVHNKTGTYICKLR